MDLKRSLADFNEKLNEWIEQAKEYFSQLNEYEKYGWIGEGVGAALLITGIVLFIL